MVDNLQLALGWIMAAAIDAQSLKFSKLSEFSISKAARQQKQTAKQQTYGYLLCFEIVHSTTPLFLQQFGSVVVA